MISFSDLNSSLESFLSSILEKGFFLEYEVFLFMFISGCRFAEVVNRGDWTIDSNLNLSFDTLKNGGRRTIQLDEDMTFVIMSAQENENYHLSRNYEYYLKFFQARYEFSNLRIGKKSVGLHLFRHNRVKQKYLELGNVDLVRDYFKLSSNAVTSIYINSLIE
jgi:hypothetical protein